MRNELIAAGVDVNLIEGAVNVTAQTDGAGTKGTKTMTVTSTAGYTAGRVYRITQGNLKEYRYCNEVTDATTFTFSDDLLNTYTAATVEDGWVEEAFDLPLAELSLHLIFRSMIREPGDRNELLSEEFKAGYKDHLASARFSYDAGRDHYIDVSEVNSRSTVGSIPIYR